MLYTDAFGESVDVNVGDEVYVDEGDSVGCTEFQGVVSAVTSDGVTLASGQKFHPSAVCDVEVLATRPG